MYIGQIPAQLFRRSNMGSSNKKGQLPKHSTVQRSTCIPFLKNK